MLKGVNKQIIEINDTGNAYFEKVLFFVKPECCALSHKKLEMGAQDYVEQLRTLGQAYAGGYLRQREQRKRRRLWLAGLCIFGICATLISVICLL